MIAVIFESWPAENRMQTYLDMGKSLQSRLEGVDGFVSIERFQSVSDPGKLVALSFWRDEAAVDSFRSGTSSGRQQSGSSSRRFLSQRLNPP
jgi:heme-degrading monooxygenase HmoA